jgi:Cu(I)/Ag(I) efflux system protein CusF
MKFAHSLTVSAILAVAALTSAASFAQTPTNPGKSGAVKPDTPKDITEGEIRKVDKDAGKLTIKHGDIRNLDMPAMTMVFQVRDKATLDKLQAGDKIKFKALSENGKLVATEIQPVK